MSNYALTFVSKDKPGIVAKVSKVLYEQGFNINDSSSTRLRGVFSMIMLVSHFKPFTTDEVKSFFIPYGLKPSVHEINDKTDENDSNCNYIISVYGADKPGIVHSIASKLAELNINITDLQTQLTGNKSNEVYVMIMEVNVPDSVQSNWLQLIKETAAGINTDITVRLLETYEL